YIPSSLSQSTLRPYTTLFRSCSDNSTNTPTISVSEESTYENTFIDLNLGVLFDFNLHLPHADHRWIKIWVEKYENGKKDTEPLKIGRHTSELQSRFDLVCRLL